MSCVTFLMAMWLESMDSTLKTLLATSAMIVRAKMTGKLVFSCPFFISRTKLKWDLHDVKAEIKRTLDSGPRRIGTK